MLDQKWAIGSSLKEVIWQEKHDVTDKTRQFLVNKLLYNLATPLHETWDVGKVRDVGSGTGFGGSRVDRNTNDVVVIVAFVPHQTDFHCLISAGIQSKKDEDGKNVADLIPAHPPFCQSPETVGVGSKHIKLKINALAVQNGRQTGRSRGRSARSALFNGIGRLFFTLYFWTFGHSK